MDERPGLTKRQAEILMHMIHKALDLVIEDDDDRDRHFALMVFTREHEEIDGEDVISTNVVATIDKDWLHQLVRGWLHQATH
jgi:hypothetical protein